MAQFGTEFHTRLRLAFQPAPGGALAAFGTWAEADAWLVDGGMIQRFPNAEDPANSTYIAMSSPDSDLVLAVIISLERGMKHADEMAR